MTNTNTIETDNTSGELDGVHAGTLSGYKFQAAGGSVTFQLVDGGIRGIANCTATVRGQQVSFSFEH